MRFGLARLRWPTRVGLVLLVLGTGPLLLYIAFGPRDGNPIGLGLLFFFSFPAAAILLLWGGAAALFRRLRYGPAGPDDIPSHPNRARPGPGTARPPRKHSDDWP
jgi:hypothetical protein